MKIYVQVVGELSSNCIAVYDENTGKGVLFDCGGNYGLWKVFSFKKLRFIIDYKYSINVDEVVANLKSRNIFIEHLYCLIFNI